MTEGLTVGIGTRDRPDSLVRCLRSLREIGAALAGVIVVDDGSEPPLEPGVRAALGEDAPPGLRFIRVERSRGVSAGRNTIAREARTEWVLNLDDDTVVVSGDGVRDALGVMRADPRVGVVALAQADAAGEAWPHGQPAPVAVPSYVAAFIGFAHLVRRSAFLGVGGFQERLGINGEEKELSLRLWDAGWTVVYLPHARVAHLADPGGRDPRRYLHQVVRNDVLASVLNLPLPLAAAGAAVRLLRYFPMRRGWKIDDPGGFARVVRALAGELPGALRERKPVKLSTLRKWRALVRRPPPYTGPSGEAP
ncbi:MAG TPA: glycosyltransferase [Longimicrobium sp.]|nr:glycosyltransferase [Longimicrobium sp.]